MIQVFDRKSSPFLFAPQGLEPDPSCWSAMWPCSKDTSAMSCKDDSKAGSMNQDLGDGRRSAMTHLRPASLGGKIHIYPYLYTVVQAHIKEQWAMYFRLTYPHEAPDQSKPNLAHTGEFPVSCAGFKCRQEPKWRFWRTSPRGPSINWRPKSCQKTTMLGSKRFMQQQTTAGLVAQAVTADGFLPSSDDHMPTVFSIHCCVVYCTVTTK